MKKSLIILLVCSFSALHMSAVNLSEVKITKTTNSLITHNSAVATLLPNDYQTVIFDGSGVPTMDQLYFLMTTPVSFANYLVGSTTMRASTNYLLSYEADYANNCYVMSREPFDPTTTALEPIDLAKQTHHEALKLKVYIAGCLSAGSKVKAELPEMVKLNVVPTYLQTYEEELKDYIVTQIHNTIDPKFDNNFSFNQNTEGFFYFTGGNRTAEDNIALELYLDDLDISVQDKQIDFLGMMLIPYMEYNLSGMEPTYTADSEFATIFNDITSFQSWASTYVYADEEVLNSEFSVGYLVYIASLSDDYTNALNSDIVTHMPENYIKALSANQIRLLKDKLTETQYGYLTYNQVQSLKALDGNALPSFTSSQQSWLNQNLTEATIKQKAKNIIAGRIDIEDMLGSQSLGFEFVSSMFSSLVQGTASPIAFSSNSDDSGQPFKVNVHTRGTVTLNGGAKGEFKNTAKEMEYIVVEGLKADPASARTAELTDLSTIFQQMVNFTSAPMSVRPSAKVIASGAEDDFKYSVTRLTFDDEVPINGTTTHVNGLLQLPVVGDDLDAPSIDIGTPYGQVIFNSGQYKFHTPVSNKVKNMFYVASMSICYRELFVTMPMVGKITYAGIGSSVGTGPSGDRTGNTYNVIINDGTFSTYSSEDWASPLRGQNAVDGVANGWYKDYTDWRLPYNTQLLGGSFTNCDVYRCDAAAEQGSSPIYTFSYVDGGKTVYDTVFLCERTEKAATALAATTNANGTLNTSPKYFRVDVNTAHSKTWDYNISSITPQDGKAWLYLPSSCGKEPTTYTHNYTTALVPLGEYHMGTNMMEMGGDVEVNARYQDIYDQTNAYLLYTQLGYYTRKYAGVEFMGGVTRTIEQEMQIEAAKHRDYTNANDKTGLVFSEVTNETDYDIQYGIYMMIPIMSDQWFMFTAPFDVANVYVLETTTKRGSSTFTDAQWEEYYKAQGEADGNMAQVLVTSVLPDVFSGKGSGVYKPLPYILQNLTNSQTRLRQLTHFTGSNFATANYYLQVLKTDKEEHQMWTLESDQKQYGNKWEMAPATSEPTFIQQRVCTLNCDRSIRDREYEMQTVYYKDQDGNDLPRTCVMKKDMVYSMFFPGGAMRYYDYKYLIIEGYGPQTIKGKNAFESYYSPKSEDTMYFPAEGYVGLQGNNTFANDTIKSESAVTLFYPKRTQIGTYASSGSVSYEFEPVSATTHMVLPTKVYMVSSNHNAVKAMPPLHDSQYNLQDEYEITIQNLEKKSLEAWSDQGIYLRGYETQQITVFTTDGRTLWHGTIDEGTTLFIPATTGLYIIQGEETTVKLIVNN